MEEDHFTSKKVGLYENVDTAETSICCPDNVLYETSVEEEPDCCHFCDEGLYEKVTEPTTAFELSQGRTIEVPQFSYLRCKNCGDKVVCAEEVIRVECIIEAKFPDYYKTTTIK